MTRGEVCVGKAGERVDAVDQRPRRMVGRDPLPVDLGRLVVDPYEGALGCPPGKEHRLPMQATRGLVVGIGKLTTGKAGRPSRGETTSFASAIHVVAQTS